MDDILKLVLVDLAIVYVVLVAVLAYKLAKRHSAHCVCECCYEE